MRHGNLMIVLATTNMLMALVAADGPSRYPQTRRVDHFDDYHGTKLADPYRWLENDVRESKEVADWVAAQNKVTFGYLETIPEREGVKKRLTALWDFEKYHTPFKAGGRYFYEKNDGLQNQYVFYVLDKLDGEPRVLLDPNKLSKDGTVALTGTAVSDDGRYLAYGLAEAGSDWNTWKIRDVASSNDLGDELKWIKYGGVNGWTLDGKGLFYNRYDEPQKGAEFQATTRNAKVYYHRAKHGPGRESYQTWGAPDAT
jgi:prolyl oligopeptidase